MLLLMLVAHTVGDCTTKPHLRVNGNDIKGINTTSAAACCVACGSTSGCTFYTFVQSKNLCWLKSSGAGSSTTDPDCTSGANVRPPKSGCTSNIDCNHAGECTGGKCACSAPFSGEQCESFTLYNYKASEGGLQISEGNTSWGGSVLEADDGTFHMYVAIMSNNGTLGTWLQQSQIAHAVSKTGPQGPYLLSDVPIKGRGGHWYV